MKTFIHNFFTIDCASCSLVSHLNTLYLIMYKGGIMRKRYLVIGIILLFICMSFNPSSALDNPVSNGNTLYVGGSGEGNYSKIQDAVDNASIGDTVFVFGNSSSYHENIVINKSIFLIGEDKNNVVIDGDFIDNVITITADYVFVSGFTMIHPHTSINDWDSVLVDIISSENVTIKDNIIHQYEVHYGDNNAGIILRNSSYCFIQNNTVVTEPITQKAYGVVLIQGSTFNNISGNEVTLFISGIYIDKWNSDDDCSNNIIYMNYLHHNRNGIETFLVNNNAFFNNIIKFNSGEGIRLDMGYNNIIFRNIITDNGEGDIIERGIGIIGGANNYISYNMISKNNPYGIHIVGTHFNNITYNTISENNIGLFFDTGYKNYIVKNNFIDNKKGGYFDRFISIKEKMVWDENYWNRPRSFPYPIFGKGYLPLISFRWVVFDWHPAQEPYDI